MHPSVINLQLHLPNQQLVSYWENQNLQQLIGFEYASKTMLTQYFQMCQTNEDARKLLYKEFPEYYVWDKSAKEWLPRKKGYVISRINGANPIEGERYYLRLLLNHVVGPSSFQHLLTVERRQCLTFKEAAQRRGLLESDQSMKECLDEAVVIQMPYALRRLFATLLVYCEPTEVRTLWNLYLLGTVNT